MLGQITSVFMKLGINNKIKSGCISVHLHKIIKLHNNEEKTQGSYINNRFPPLSQFS